jgi:hypothetical protein
MGAVSASGERLRFESTTHVDATSDAEVDEAHASLSATAILQCSARHVVIATEKSPIRPLLFSTEIVHAARGQERAAKW